MKISMIVAMSTNRVIGVDNQLPWKLSGDMAWFKKQTMNKVMAIIYLIVCGLYLHTKLVNDASGAEQVSWAYALLPEILLVALIVTSRLLKIVDFFLKFANWRAFGKGKTNIMQKPPFLSQAVNRLLYALCPFKKYFHRTNESAPYRHARELRKQMPA